nr:hypothetical protein [Tanacetum cinerariifolium]
SHSIPASSSQSWNYDVYLSFREDTRKTFVDHLYVALMQQGIETYNDDQKLRNNIPIHPLSLKAIEESRIFIIIFSKNYASSSWCLDELACIIKHMEERKQIVFPIFYDVEPTDVRKQSGKFREVFASQSKNIMKAELWRRSLSKASDLAGWELKNTANGREAKLIKKIVDAVSYELLSLLSTSSEATAETSVDTELIEIETRIQELESLLEVGSGGVHMVGICRPVKGYEEISLNIVTKFGGHPSALSSLGSFLHGKDMTEWKCVLAKLEAQDPMYDTGLLLFGQSADYRKLWLHLKPKSCGNWVKSVGNILRFPIHNQAVAISFLDALDSATGGNFLDKIPRECLSIIESKSKVRYSRSRVTDVRANANAPLSSSSHSNSFDLQQIAASLEDKLDIRMNCFEKSLNDMKNYFITPTAPLKAVEEVCVTYGANHSYN